MIRFSNSDSDYRSDRNGLTNFAFLANKNRLIGEKSS